MSQIKRILVPVDFSEQSVNALEYAYSLASETKAQVLVVHVVKRSAYLDYLAPELPPVEGWPLLLQDPPRLPVDVLLRESALDLANFLEKNGPKARQVKLTKKIRLGKPIKEIAAIAREERVDLVVLGVRKRFLFSHLVSGHLLKTITRLPCPVLLAPPTSRDLGEPDYTSYPFCEEWLSDSAISLDRWL